MHAGWDILQGEVLDGMRRHGQGKHSGTGGEVYEGAWRLDQRHGRGRFTAADGTVYEGAWQQDKAHGCDAAALVCVCVRGGGSRVDGGMHGRMLGHSALLLARFSLRGSLRC